MVVAVTLLHVMLDDAIVGMDACVAENCTPVPSPKVKCVTLMLVAVTLDEVSVGIVARVAKS